MRTQLMVICVVWIWPCVSGTNDPLLQACHVETRKMQVEKPYFLPNGERLDCYDVVKVKICMGLCDSHEMGTYHRPYKISHHPQCSYDNKVFRTVRLKHCHHDHPDPSYTVFDAETCVCKKCSSHNASCQSLLG
ncbi:thyrostimulin beta-5 subunit-like [Tubulanus polymorphus]|uniref:thyrostimulin beta-5 subunit-like n=1 Tax=Tubulanus polymorphus TaxID=672921 RepID=UPI003DA6172B